MPSFFFHVSVDIKNPPSGPDRSLPSHLDSFRPFGSKLKASPPKLKAGSIQHSIDPPRKPENLKVEEAAEKTRSTKQNHSQSLTNPPPPCVDDWRWGNVSVQRIDMASNTTTNTQPRAPSSKGGVHINNGIAAGTANGFTTKGRFEPSTVPQEEELGWGIIRLYRDAEETPGLDDDISTTAKATKHGRATAGRTEKLEKAKNDQLFSDEDCTTLCILAVPSYLTPSDFLGFVGEKTRESVSHFRMIRTDRVNRYMVLMKFRSGRSAREWRKDWNGKPFNDMEAENCHVAFVKSIQVRDVENTEHQPSFPDMRNDPFTPSEDKGEGSGPKAQTSKGLNSKPMAPSTPSLIELPTCPVCLERMDESTGLLTILCQHVFHCSCLEKWRGSGCPVCRYTQDGPLSRGLLHHTGDDASNDVQLNECGICRSDANLWICLICGNVGCGRYDAAHAFLHYKQSAHSFAMDLTTQRVWDYSADGYVHRIMQSKTDGKLVELPAAADNYDHNSGGGTRVVGAAASVQDVVPRDKLDAIGREYTALLTSQLDSQRAYFEQRLERAADKASEASRAAALATEASNEALARLASLQLAHDALERDTVPTLERECDRATRRADRFEEMARSLEREWREEKAVSGSLMERIKFLDAEGRRLKETNEELAEQNRDLTFFISGKEKLEGMGMGEDVVEGTASVPEKHKKGKGKGKGKGKNKAGGAGTGDQGEA